MKEKRYFCDYYETAKIILKGVCITLIIVLTVGIVHIIENYVATYNKFEAQYQRLEECIDNILKEESSIDIDMISKTKIPQDIDVTIRYEEGEMILEGNYEKLYGFSVKVNLSQKEKQIVRQYQSYDEYKKAVIISWIAAAFIIALFISLTIYYTLAVIFEILNCNSLVKHRVDEVIVKEVFMVVNS